MLNVLLVEDNPADVLMVREALETSPAQAQVLIAYDGEQALRLLRNSQHHFDLVILDLNVPKCNGHKILQQQCGVQGGPAFVVFSGSDNPSDRQGAQALGAKDYVVKPFMMDDFIRVVQAMVHKWGRVSQESGNGVHALAPPARRPLVS